MNVSELKAAYRLAVSLGDTDLALVELSDPGCDLSVFVRSAGLERMIDITRNEIVGVLTTRRESLLGQLAAIGIYPDPLPDVIERPQRAVPRVFAPGEVEIRLVGAATEPPAFCPPDPTWDEPQTHPAPAPITPPSLDDIAIPF